MPLTIRRRLVDRVRQLRKIAYAVCAALVVLSAAVVFLSISSPTSTIEVTIGPTFFDSNRSFRLAEDMWKEGPERSLGSEDAAKVATWVKGKFSAFGKPVVQEFQAPLGDRQVT